MKKALLVLTLVLIIGVTATFAYAQVSSPESGINYVAWKDWFKRENGMEEDLKLIEHKMRFNYKDEAELWNKHLDYMERFHMRKMDLCQESAMVDMDGIREMALEGGMMRG